MVKKKENIFATGRRKTAVASVYIRDGKGKVKVNDRPLEDYFSSEFQREAILAPLKKLALQNSFDRKLLSRSVPETVLLQV